MPPPNSTDSNFEKTFSDLAFTRIQDKAPSLLKYLIGFQLIAKNDDETHAVGVFGFKVGSQWVYAPIFFINGELKGHELMWVKNLDLICPMEEEWINSIKQQASQPLGQSEPTPRTELGMRQPDFNVFARVPYMGSKFASNPVTYNSVYKMLERDNPDFLPVLDLFVVGPRDVKYAGLEQKFDLPRALKLMGKRAAYRLVNTMTNDHAFADSVLRFYKVNDIIGFAKSAEKLDKDAAGYSSSAPAKNCKDCENFFSHSKCKVVQGDVAPNGSCNYFRMASVHDEIAPVSPLADNTKLAAAGDTKIEGTCPKPIIVTRGDNLSSLVHGLTESEKKKLLADGHIVKDERTRVDRTIVYKTQVGMQFSSPAENGFYEVATSNNGRRKLLLFPRPLHTGGPGAFRQDHCLAVDPETKEVGVFNTAELMTTQQLNNFKGWTSDSDVPGLQALSAIKPKDIVIIISPKFQGTTVFRVKKMDTNQEGHTEIQTEHVWLREPAQSSFLTSHGYRDNNGVGAVCYSDSSRATKNLVLTKKPGDKMNIVGSTIFVPKECKCIIIKQEDERKMESDWWARPKQFSSGPGVTNEIGILPEVALSIMKSAGQRDGLQRLAVHTDGIGFAPYLNEQPQHMMSKLAALKFLITNLGLGEDDANLLMQEAQPGIPTKVLLKVASPFQAQFEEPPLDSTFNGKARVRYPHSTGQGLGDSSEYGSNLREYLYDPYVDDDAKAHANQAAQRGDKDVFDTSVIGGLVKNQDVDSLVNRYISDMTLGMDRLGRTLFLYYWHNEKFEEKYGKQDMQQIEGNLRNVFKNTGDIVLFLKKKSVEPAMSVRTSEPRLDSVMA